MTSPTFDLIGFRAINGLAGHNVWLDAFGIFCSQYLIFVMAAFAVAYFFIAWRTGKLEDRFENDAHAFVTVALAVIIKTVIGFIWFRPRPFVDLPNVTKLIAKAATEPSFPSGHATAAFAIAFGLLMHDRRWGWPLVVMALFVGLGRIYVGVHYPTDIVAGIVVAAVAAALTAPIKKRLAPMLDWVPLFRKR